ncbi:MAG: PadR family transcriptional regulator [Candidatus Bathyarchaeota archaeon]|jgi:DNA-binding PadR family transcriptional regulator
MRKNEIDLMILGSLLLGPAHGYELKRRVTYSFGLLYPNLSNSILYPRLAKFEKEGLIKGKVEPQHDAPDRKVYQLTGAGFEHVKFLVATPIKFSASTGGTYADELTVHIVFFSLITKEERCRVIEPYYNIALKRYDDAVTKLGKSKKPNKFNVALLEFAVLALKNTIEFYEKLMEMD